MEELLLRFPYVGEEIFDRLDEKSLGICKKVCRSWKKFIEDPTQKFMWIQIIKELEENTCPCLNRYSENLPLMNYISGPKPKWSKLRIQDLREFVKRLNSEQSVTKLIAIFLEKYVELKVELNGADWCGKTIFHLACRCGKSELANILMKEYSNLKIDLNAKDLSGRTAFHYACCFGRIDVAKMMIENAESSKLDFKIKDCYGRTAFQLAESRRNHGIVDLIKRKLPAGTF